MDLELLPSPTSTWALPDAAWQAITRRLCLADVLSARLACRAWRKDLSAFVLGVRVLPTHVGTAGGASQLLRAFPHAARVCVDISSCEQRAAVCGAVQQLGAAVQPLVSSDDAAAAGCGRRSRSAAAPSLQLDAARRSYHCPSSTEHPASSDDAGTVIECLSVLPRVLEPDLLAALCCVRLGTPPQHGSAWAALASLPALTELELPAFRPALQHDQLPGLGRLSGLRALTLSVQGSFTAWRANCDAFMSLSRLSLLRRLCLHAFHCPGVQLASALRRMPALEELRLSGRVVLSPLSSLAPLTRLRLLALTQDMQHRGLVELLAGLPCLRHIALGRVTQLPPAMRPTLAQPDDALGVAAPVLHAVVPAVADGAAADGAAADGAAAAAVVAAGGAAAAGLGAGLGAGDGEVALEDVGGVVDGLVGNLAEGDVPLHLQRIIERFESIIQLDLTRRVSSAPWGWPLCGASAVLAGTSSRRDLLGPVSVAHASGQRMEAEAACCASLELALLRPSDVAALCELPERARACAALALRLRDQLLAFASVSPVRLRLGELNGLGTAFPALTSLALSGKVALDGQSLLELCYGCRQLTHLSLDCHFVAVCAAHAHASLGELQGLQALCLRHRGSGKLPLAVTALPTSLTMLAVKKLMLYEEAHQQAKTCDGRSCTASPSSQAAHHRLLSEVEAPTPPLSNAPAAAAAASLAVVECHAITSPGFQQQVLSDRLPATESVTDQNIYELQGIGDSAARTGDRGCDTKGSLILPSMLMQLPSLASLHLRSCLVSEGAIRHILGGYNEREGDHNGVGSCHLTCLAVTGDIGSQELADNLAAWTRQLASLSALQVVDISLPEQTFATNQSHAILASLQLLRNLQHVHVSIGHRSEFIVGLTTLSRLSTLAASYTGPPALPVTLLGANWDVSGREQGRSRAHYSAQQLLRFAGATVRWGLMLMASWGGGWCAGGMLGRGRHRDG